MPNIPRMTQQPIPQSIAVANSPFAAFTFEKRIPFIFDQIRSNNKLTPAQTDELVRLLAEIQTGVVAPMPDDFLPIDRPYWEKFIKKHGNRTYADVPFFEAEAYIYYRIMRIVDYPNSGVDPFGKLKKDGVEENLAVLDGLAHRHQNEGDHFNEDYFTVLLYNALWANSADLSQIDAHDVLRDERLRGRLVIDHIPALIHQINKADVTALDYVVDNAGIELMADFFLADYLLRTGRVQRINLHVKQYPIFVSDATEADVAEHLAIMLQAGSESLAHFSRAVQDWQEAGKLRVISHPFWNSPLHFTEMPADLTGGFDEGSLLLFKGDANYRRLFEDRAWPPSTSIADVLHYFKQPCASIRTLKSEIVLGISDQQAARLTKEDPDWLTNGRYGLVMFQPAP